MAISDRGTVPETLVADAGTRLDRADPLGDEVSVEPDRPEAEPSAEEVLRDVREATRENGTGAPGKIAEAVAASEAEVGAAATRDRILSGELTAADGTTLLDGLSQDQRVALAQGYETGVRQQTSGPDGDLTSEMTNMKHLEERGVQPLLAAHFQDPEAAMDRLKSLDEDGQAALARGDTSVLGDLRDDVSLDGREARQLGAFADWWDQNPEAAARITESQAHDRADALRADLDGPEVGPDRGAPDAPRSTTPDDPMTNAERYEADPGRKGIEDDRSILARMEHQIGYDSVRHTI